MSPASKTFLILAAACAAVLADPALAGRHGRKTARARANVAADAASTAAGARLLIRMIDTSSTDWELRMQLHRAPAGLAPEAFIADAAGTLVSAGTFATDDDNTSGEYRLRLRGSKGDALPVDATTLSDLGGRAFEIRDADVVLVAGDLPTPASKSSSTSTGAGSTSTATTGGADDGATHDATEHAAGDDSTTGTAGSGGTTSTDDASGHDGGSGSGSGSGDDGGSSGHGGDDSSGHR